MHIKYLKLSKRPRNALTNAGITTTEQLFKLNLREIEGIKDLGKTSTIELLWACVQLLNGDLAERERELHEANPYEEGMYHKLEKARKLVNELQGVLKRP